MYSDYSSVCTWNPQNIPEITLFLRNRNSTIIAGTLPSKYFHVQLYISANDSKVVGNILASHFVKTFSARPSHS